MAQEQHDNHFRAYAMVALALLVLTVVTYFAAESFHTTFQRALSGLLIAIAKASLVVAIFMHLRWDWRKKVWFMVVPAVALSLVLLLALFPDIAHRKITHPPYGGTVVQATAEVQHGEHAGH